MREIDLLIYQIMRIQMKTQIIQIKEKAIIFPEKIMQIIEIIRKITDLYHFHLNPI